jgi:hypothetical protein
VPAIETALYKPDVYMVLCGPYRCSGSRYDSREQGRGAAAIEMVRPRGGFTCQLSVGERYLAYHVYYEVLDLRGGTLVCSRTGLDSDRKHQLPPQIQRRSRCKLCFLCRPLIELLEG